MNWIEHSKDQFLNLDQIVAAAWEPATGELLLDTPDPSEKIALDGESAKRVYAIISDAAKSCGSR